MIVMGTVGVIYCAESVLPGVTTASVEVDRDAFDAFKSHGSRAGNDSRRRNPRQLPAIWTSYTGEVLCARNAWGGCYTVCEVYFALTLALLNGDESRSTAVSRVVLTAEGPF